MLNCLVTSSNVEMVSVPSERVDTITVTIFLRSVGKKYKAAHSFHKASVDLRKSTINRKLGYVTNIRKVIF